MIFRLFTTKLVSLMYSVFFSSYITRLSFWLYKSLSFCSYQFLAIRIFELIYVLPEHGEPSDFQLEANDYRLWLVFNNIFSSTWRYTKFINKNCQTKLLGTIISSGSETRMTSFKNWFGTNEKTNVENGGCTRYLVTLTQIGNLYINLSAVDYYID